MKAWLDRLLWGRLFHPRNKRLFRLRIRLRVQWLRLTLWWREDVSFRAIIGAFPRPLAVLVLGLGLPFLMFWLMLRFGTVTPEQLTNANPFRADKPIPWQAAGQLLLLFVGLPAAFMLWAFRDYHVNATLANQRKDVNLKEFQEIQMRAAGALDEKLPAEAREQLQIAALHQLRAFLRGDFGPDFRRPAFELLLAGHAAAEARIGLREAIERWRKGAPAPRLFRDEMHKASTTAHERRSAVDRERAGIIRDEWKSVFLAGFPLNGRLLDGIALPHPALLARLELTGSSFTGADLSWAHLEGANFYEAHLEGADLAGASFDDKTTLLEDWDSCSPDDRAAAQQKLRDRGARHVDDPPAGDA